jgi:type I restriction enzyme S subunit
MKAKIKKRIEAVRRGEVPEGYKKTKVGVVPEGWEVRKAKEIFKVYSNKKHGGNYPVLSSTQNFGIIPRDSLNIDIKYDKDNIDSYKKVDIGDYVISLRSFQGGIEYSDFEGLVSPAYTVLKNIIPISNIYYKEYFKTPEFISRLNGSIYGIRDGKQIGYEDFSDLLLHNPPYPEQRKIAEILDACDEVIQLKESLLMEKRKQKKWLLENLLDPDSGVRLPGFKGEWEKSTIEDLFSFGVSLSASRNQLSSVGFCYLHYGDIHTNTDYYVDVDKNYDSIPKLSIPKIDSKFHLDDGDVVFVDASEDYDGVSKFVVVKNPNNKPFISGLHTIPLHPVNKMLNNIFKIYCFQSIFVKNQMRFFANGMKVFGLNKNSLAKIELMYPKFEEQKAVARVLFQVDSEINLLDKELGEWCKLKKVLMRVLLTGMVRMREIE